MSCVCTHAHTQRVEGHSCPQHCRLALAFPETSGAKKGEDLAAGARIRAAWEQIGQDGPFSLKDEREDRRRLPGPGGELGAGGVSLRVATYDGCCTSARGGSPPVFPF